MAWTRSGARPLPRRGARGSADTRCGGLVARGEAAAAGRRDGPGLRGPRRSTIDAWHGHRLPPARASCGCGPPIEPAPAVGRRPPWTRQALDGAATVAVQLRYRPGGAPVRRPSAASAAPRGRTPGRCSAAEDGTACAPTPTGGRSARSTSGTGSASDRTALTCPRSGCTTCGTAPRASTLVSGVASVASFGGWRERRGAGLRGQRGAGGEV